MSNDKPQSDLIIVSGLSGAGKSIVLDMLEDLDFYCIDNLPLSLLNTLHPRALAKMDQRFNRLAIGVDSRTGGYFEELPDLLRNFKEAFPGFQIRVLFLYADDEILLRRFSETRRKHPLTNAQTTLPDALIRERQLLAPVAEMADVSIDTSHSNLHELRERIRHLIATDTAHHMLLQLQSFGFKHGVPDGVDMVFDVRCLPNPHWEPSLREFTGRDPAIKQWLSEQKGVREMSADIASFIQRWLPAYQKQNRNYLTVAIGCTGGQHRSVYVVELLSEQLAAAGRQIVVRHTEIQ